MAASIEIRADGLVYFTADDGRAHRVYDVCFGPPEAPPGMRRVHPPPYEGANYRHFIGADGMQRGYRFARQDSHALTVAELERQLRNAGYLATGRFDSTNHGPR
jgi:hypothetical protein